MCQRRQEEVELGPDGNVGKSMEATTTTLPPTQHQPCQPVSRTKPAVQVSMRTNGMAFPPSLVTMATVPTTPSTPPKLRWLEVAAPLGPFALQTPPLYPRNFLVGSTPPPPLHH